MAVVAPRSGSGSPNADHGHEAVLRVLAGAPTRSCTSRSPARARLARSALRAVNNQSQYSPSRLQQRQRHSALLLHRQELPLHRRAARIASALSRDAGRRHGDHVLRRLRGDDTPISIRLAALHPGRASASALGGHSRRQVLDPNADFSARPLAPRDTSGGGPWDYANSSFDVRSPERQRFIITQIAKANDWIEQNICQPFHLEYRFDGQGRVVPIDLRVSSSTAVSGAIVDSDLVELPKAWATDGSQAQLGANVTYYVDMPKLFENLIDSADPFRTSPPICSTSSTLRSSSSIRTPYLRGTPATRSRRSTRPAPADRERVLRGARPPAQHRQAEQDPLGDVRAARAVRRRRRDDSPPAAPELRLRTSGREGQFWTITASSTPDPATSGGQRGGARVGLCLSRNERGLAVEATFLDVGSATSRRADLLGALSDYEWRAQCADHRECGRRSGAG
jgi:hypothetical protein